MRGLSLGLKAKERARLKATVVLGRLEVSACKDRKTRIDTENWIGASRQKRSGETGTRYPRTIRMVLRKA
jgi:hypothetical protein